LLSGRHKFDDRSRPRALELVAGSRVKDEPGLMSAKSRGLANPGETGYRPSIVRPLDVRRQASVGDEVPWRTGGHTISAS
jgi:hypothetical protein